MWHHILVALNLELLVSQEETRIVSFLFAELFWRSVVEIKYFQIYYITFFSTLS